MFFPWQKPWTCQTFSQLLILGTLYLQSWLLKIGPHGTKPLVYCLYLLKVVANRHHHHLLKTLNSLSNSTSWSRSNKLILSSESKREKISLSSVSSSLIFEPCFSFHFYFLFPWPVSFFFFFLSFHFLLFVAQLRPKYFSQSHPAK